MKGTFLSCDWGTSQFRLRWVELPETQVRAEFVSDEGVGRLAAGFQTSERPKAFRQCLERSVASLAKMARACPSNCPIVISGMASSTIGWQDLPYANLPFALDGSNLQSKKVESISLEGKTLPVYLLSGVKGPMEIMRGEETQLLGLAGAGFPMADQAIVLLPGTHSKHARLRSGQLIDFCTWMTGELFQLLSEHSVLRHSVAPINSHGNPEQIWPESLCQAFRQGVQAALNASPLQHLFWVRTRQVLQNADPRANSVFLSGLLTGGEVSGLAGARESGVPIILCGGEHLIQPYQLALTELGMASRLQTVTDTGRLSILGQAVFLQRMLDSGGEIGKLFQ